jgi:GT2 family glycosyltransferase
VSEPALSVVVASVNGFPYLGRCLDSLREFAPAAEVIVADCTDDETRRRVREGWPDVRLLSFEEPTSVPALRAAGIFAAAAPHVAVIEDHCLVRDAWAGKLLAAHGEGHAVVGGPICNGAGGRVRDWAGFLFEYSRFLEPGEPGPVDDVPGMNVSYGRPAIEAVADLLREGKWESWLNRRLRERGFELHYEPAAAIEHDKDFGVRDFVAQRFHYARAHADMRNPELGGKRVVYALGSPLLPPLLFGRVVRNVFRAGRCRPQLLAATPLLLLYAAVTALGEAIGYVLGGGRSLLRVK